MKSSQRGPGSDKVQKVSLSLLRNKNLHKSYSFQQVPLPVLLLLGNPDDNVSPQVIRVLVEQWTVWEELDSIFLWFYQTFYIHLTETPTPNISPAGWSARRACASRKASCEVAQRSSSQPPLLNWRHFSSLQLQLLWEEPLCKTSAESQTARSAACNDWDLWINC